MDGKGVGIIIAALLTGCASLPEATSQIRITEGTGEASARYPFLAGIEGQGQTCIVSVVGELPANLCVVYEGERCTVRLCRQ